MAKDQWSWESIKISLRFEDVNDVRILEEQRGIEIWLVTVIYRIIQMNHAFKLVQFRKE
ncbi:hypothetical protein J2T12_000986 [Paenibacillus anaericanus]|nr:hypothetical protein [Paenibacillus anaericanus]